MNSEEKDDRLRYLRTKLNYDEQICSTCLNITYNSKICPDCSSGIGKNYEPVCQTCCGCNICFNCDSYVPKDKYNIFYELCFKCVKYLREKGELD